MKSRVINRVACAPGTHRRRVCHVTHYPSPASDRDISHGERQSGSDRMKRGHLAVRDLKARPLLDPRHGPTSLEMTRNDARLLTADAHLDINLASAAFFYAP